MANVQHCKICDEFGHTAFYCPDKIRKPLRKTTQLKSAGKYTRKWQTTRRKWKKENPPNHAGYYSCYICYKAVPANEVEIDHIKSRSRYPELRYEQSNLAPICHECNTLKGSKDLQEL